MNLVSMTYHGRKVYKDKLSGIDWEPGSVHWVRPDAARRLRQFVEFGPGPQEADKPGKPQAVPDVRRADEQQAQAMVEREQGERQEVENMLLALQGMDKEALLAYAQHYDVKLDKRLGEQSLRARVSQLIEQFGVR